MKYAIVEISGRQFWIDETNAAPNPRLTAVLIASIEFNSIITLNCLV